MLKTFQYGGEPRLDEDAVHAFEALLSKPPVIEITSSGSHQGKTQLLYYLTAIAILPPIDGSSRVSLGGLDSTVVVLDTDGRFDVMRLAQVMQFYISAYRVLQFGSPNEPERWSAQDIVANDDDSALIRACLKHVHVFCPKSSEALLATLDSLEEWLYNFDEHESASRPLSAVLLDSVSSLYWQERRRVDDAKLPMHHQTNDQSSSAIEPTLPPQNTYAVLRRNLTALSKKYSCLVVIATRSSSQNTRQGPLEATIPPELPLPWSTFPTLRLHIRKMAVDKFPPMHSIREALRDQSARQEIVNQGRYEILLNHWSADAWSEGVKSALGKRATTISMWIGDEGTWVKHNEATNERWPPWMALFQDG